jgi:ketosteroid isomerase-like protein
MAEPMRDVLEIARRLFTSTTARDWAEFSELIHPDAEISLRSEPGRIIRGRAEMDEFARSVISARRAHEITVDTIEQLDEDAVVALGRSSSPTSAA